MPCAEHCHYQRAISRSEGTQKKGEKMIKEKEQVS